MNKTMILAAAIMTTFALGAGAEASAQQAALAPSGAAQQPAFMAIQGQTRPPIGWVQFCRDHAAECRSEPRTPRDAALTRARWAELTEINRRVNRDIEPVADQDQYGVAERWTYPDSGKGDCEDFVLLKRRQLIERGWPESSLLVTVVRDHRGDGHAVLTVRTTEGDLVLDNVRDEILPWNQTGYRFVKRQSQWAPNVWVALADDLGPATTARR
jgi:predicted transglutaminase-like cysteine proteinase